MTDFIYFRKLDRFDTDNFFNMVHPIDIVFASIDYAWKTIAKIATNVIEKMEIIIVSQSFRFEIVII